MNDLRLLKSLLALALLVLGFVTCATPPPKKPTVEEPPDPAAGVRKVLEDCYATLVTLEPEPFEKLLAADVVAFGLGPSDYFNGAPEVIDHLRQEFIPLGLRGEKLKVI